MKNIKYVLLVGLIALLFGSCLTQKRAMRKFPNLKEVIHDTTYKVVHDTILKSREIVLRDTINIHTLDCLKTMQYVYTKDVTGELEIRYWKDLHNKLIVEAKKNVRIDTLRIETQTKHETIVKNTPPAAKMTIWAWVLIAFLLILLLIALLKR